MYTADHIAFSVGLAAIISRRFKLKFSFLAPILILTNLVDLDHLFFYYLDDGAANSLTLHPFHIYSGVIVFFIFCLSLIDTKRSLYYFSVVAGLASHLFMDAIAFYFAYNIPHLLICSGVIFFSLFFIFRSCLAKPDSYKILLFCFIQWAVISLMQLWSSRYFIVQQSVIPWILPNVLTIIAVLLFVLFFKNLKNILDE